MNYYYYLNLDKSVRLCTLEEWGLQLEEMRRNDSKHVSDTEVNGKRVSTVWIGINHNFLGNGKPLIFETMIFDNDNNSCYEIYCDRYSTWDEALAGHEKAVQWVLDGCNKEIKE